jgi:hypothetical protein
MPRSALAAPWIAIMPLAAGVLPVGCVTLVSAHSHMLEDAVHRVIFAAFQLLALVP